MIAHYGANLDYKYGSAAVMDAVLHERVRRAPDGAGGTFVLISDTAYFVYVGRLRRARTPKYVQVQVTSAGSGAQTAEVGLFSGSGPPNKATVTLSKLVSTGTLGNLASGTGLRANTAAFTTPIAAGTYLYAGIRTAMAGSQPTLRGIELDFAEGYALATATAGALTGTGPWTGALTAGGTVTVGPVLRVEDD